MGDDAWGLDWSESTSQGFSGLWETMAPEDFFLGFTGITESCFMSDTQILKDIVTMDGGSSQSLKGASSSHCASYNLLI